MKILVQLQCQCLLLAPQFGYTAISSSTKSHTLETGYNTILETVEHLGP